MPSFGFSKSRILMGLQCPKRLWLRTHRADLELVSPETLAAFDTGHRVGEVARGLFPGGVLIEYADNIPAALAQTKSALRQDSGPLFEAAFSHRRVFVRSDILVPSREGPRAIEVKSSTSVKGYHLDDCAVQYWVLRGAGVTPDTVELAFIDTEFVYPGDGDYRGLFTFEDITGPVRERAAEVDRWLAQFRALLSGPMPDIAVGPQCTTPFECPFLHFCGRDRPQFPVGILPRAGALAEELRAQGIDDVRGIPQGRLTKPVHERIRTATVTGRAYVGTQLERSLHALPYPRHYLDFETANLAVPVWPGTRPYEQLPFQWSCHIERTDGSLDHREFLSISAEPPMRPFAESLIATLSGSGPIVVYSSFERTVLRALAARYADLAPELEKLVDRLFDLLPLLQEHYYHPEMKGSWSIKSVLPTLAAELSYENLGLIRDGFAAQQAFQQLLQGAPAAARRDALAHALREYCKRDTLAMRTVVQCLAGGSE